MARKSKDKVAVMLSGGLDSRLIVKLMQKQGFDVVALHFKLPFSKDSEKEIRKFAKEQGVSLNVFDYSKGKLFKEYLKMIQKPRFGRGSGVNPCIDCRLFMVKKAKEFMDKNKIKFLATGEVLGQRPMSQHKKGLDTVEKESRLGKRLIRPLIEQGIKGRSRGKQISMAKKFKIDYPNPAGGCLMCEKALTKRFKYLLERGLNDKEKNLIKVGRHFLIDNTWVVIGRNQEENEIIEKIGTSRNLVIPKEVGPSGIILGKVDDKIKKKVKELVKAYSKGADIKERENFAKYVLK
jgi:hypothetical protein